MSTVRSARSIRPRDVTISACTGCGYGGPVRMSADSVREIHGATFVDWSGRCPVCSWEHATMVRADELTDEDESARPVPAGEIVPGDRVTIGDSAPAVVGEVEWSASTPDLVTITTPRGSVTLPTTSTVHTVARRGRPDPIARALWEEECIARYA